MHITNLLSQYFGKFVPRFPSFIQNLINSAYVKLMKLDMILFKNAKHYKSLKWTFTRELVINRQIDNSSNIFISPTDSFITECGKLEKI